MSPRRKVPDELLAERVRRGDELAFRVLVSRYEPLVRSVCWSPPSGLDTDDLRQEALLGLLEACRVESPRSFPIRSAVASARSAASNRLSSVERSPCRR